MADLIPVFTALRTMMAPYAARLAVTRDDAGELYINTHHIHTNKQPLFFGAVQLKRTYVSFHLMPVYVHPALLAGLSPALRARMQGKSCFNFRKADPALFRELSALTKAGYAFYRAQGFVE